MYTVYALHSPKHSKINLEQRMLSHNKLATKGWTIRYRPWEVVYTEEYGNKSEAMEREKQLKSAKGREFIWEQVENNK